MAVYQGIYGSMLVETRDGWEERPIGENGYVDLSGTIAMPSGDYGGDYIANYKGGAWKALARMSSWTCSFCGSLESTGYTCDQCNAPTPAWWMHLDDMIAS